MPVQPSGVAADLTSSALSRSAFYAPASVTTLLPALGDVLPLPALGGAAYFSVGDVCLLVGVAAIVLSASSRMLESPGSTT
jgi:hypothetical protein